MTNVSPRGSRLAFFGRHRLAFAVVAALVVATIVAAATFDGNWLRGPLQHYVGARTGMTLTVRDLRIDVFDGLHATARDVRLEGVVSGEPPLLNASVIELRVFPAPLLRGRLVFRYLSLADARINLQRDGEGRTNWSRNPHVTPPANETSVRPRFNLPFDVEVLALRNVEVRYTDVPRAIDMRGRASTSDSAAAADARRTRIEVSGTYGADRFSGTALTGGLLTLQNTAQPFPIQLDLVAGRTKVAAQGEVSDLLGDVAVDGNLRMSGPSLASLYPTLPVALPSTPPYTLEGRLQAQKNDYRLSRIRGTIGRSDVSGDARFRVIAPRPFLDASLRSQRLALADLGVLVGVRDPEAVRKGATPRVLPDTRFDVPRLNAIDAAVTLVAGQMVMSPALALEDFSADVKLADGVLRLQPLKFGFSGGDIVSTIVLDGRRVPIRADAALDFRRIQFNKLFPTLDRMRLSSGAMGAQMRLTGSGQSVAEMLSSANGSLGAAMSGGRISQTVVAAASLDGGRLLPPLVRGDKPVPVRCAAVLMEVKQGIARSHLMVLDTEDVRIDGAAAIDLAAERFELELRPKPKSPSLFSVRAPVYVQGGFRDARIAVGEGALLRGGAALALAAINPLAALLPLIETGQGEDTNCARVLKPVEGALDQVDEGTNRPPPARERPKPKR